MICSVDWCEKPVKAKGWCAMHWARDMKGQDMDAPPAKLVNAGMKCTVEGCTRRAQTKQLCGMHYQRTLKSGYTGRWDAHFQRVKGPKPSKGEKDIYFLRLTDNNIPFYVGSTTLPTQRIRRHRENLSKEIWELEMVVVRVCPIGEEVYWESKLIVDLVESGLDITNLNAPHSVIIGD